MPQVLKFIYIGNRPVSAVRIPKDEKRFFETNKWPTSFWTQYKALTYRNFLESKGRIVSKTVIIGVGYSYLKVR